MKIENNLYQSGFFKTKPNYNDEVIDKAIVKEIVNFLKNKGVLELPMLKGFQYSISSYGLKHNIEKAMGKYLSMGNTIQAMIELGFDYTIDVQNCYYNISVKQLKKLRTE